MQSRPSPSTRVRARTRFGSRRSLSRSSGRPLAGDVRLAPSPTPSRRHGEVGSSASCRAERLTVGTQSGFVADQLCPEATRVVRCSTRGARHGGGYGPRSPSWRRSRVVETPVRPLGDCVRLVRVRSVKLVVRVPGGAASDVVEVVRDHVDIRVAGVVRGGSVLRYVGASVALRVPDDPYPRDAGSRPACRFVRRQPRPRSWRLQSSDRASVNEQIDTCERLLEGGSRPRRAP